jgi:phage terminase large subunit
MPTKAQEVIGLPSRYKILEGGRGSGKSFSFADALLARAAKKKLRILCTREMQNSIRDSVHRLLQDRIISNGWSSFFYVYKESIVSKCGSEFIFKGLRHNISEIKSTEGIDICWVEEAEKVSEDSWTILVPTIRKEGSEIWVSFNPESERSATYQRFVLKPPPSCAWAHMTFEDNEYFPEVLRQEMEYDKLIDFEKYEHVWLGKVKKYAEACIFKRVRVEEFDEPSGDTQFYYGADFGFSVDPSCLIRMFIKDATDLPLIGEKYAKRLYIIHEAYGHGVEINELSEFYKTVPGSETWKIRADSQRPDTISHLHNEGFDIEGAEKGAGSVEDGIQFLSDFAEIVIHPRCKGSIDDFRNYRWKQDRITNEILPVPLDKSNHACDAVRYALEPYIKEKCSCWDVI